MLRKCLKCGKLFEGNHDQNICPVCVNNQKHSSHLNLKICKECGKSFMGGPRAWYCPECRLERRRERDRLIRKTGSERPLGSIDICQVCGKEYIVTGGGQKYCPDCAKEAVAKIDRIQAKEWYKKNADNPKRRENRKAAIAEIPCPICGKMFKPLLEHQITCSDECKKIYIKNLQSKYESTHRIERNKQRKLALKERISNMTDEEFQEYRNKINERSRINYAKRKAKEKDS